ncbi:MAG: J domain-containing protein [Gammaproteobacteria bacterium]
MAGDALELALALYHAPIQRFALPGRPLPDDIGVVIQIASGSLSLLEEAATRHHERKETILEASRFYLQQVLFAPDADAYRVLGLAPDAPAERIREHYRQLQRWLHPDRRGDDWEAGFATRVNWAWQHLRNDASRRAYDAQREMQGTSESTDSRTHVSIQTGKWSSVALDRRRSVWPQRIALGMSFGSCLGLLYLVLTRFDSVLPDGLPGNSVPAATIPRDEIKPQGMTPASVQRTDARITMQTVPEVRLSEPDKAGSAMPTGLRIPLPVAVATSPPLDVPLARQVPLRPVMAIAIATKPVVIGIPEPERFAVPRGYQMASHGQGIAVANVDAKPLRVGNRPVWSEPDALARADLARQRIQDLAAYFGQFGTPSPPVWNDEVGQTGADRQRAALHDRVHIHAAVDFEVDNPAWRISRESAALSANYQLRNGRLVTESGHLSLDMIWREQMWLVTRVELTPAP